MASFTSLVLLLILLCTVGFSPMLTANRMFKKKCLDRHFWLSVKSNYSNSEVRFDFEDQHGYHILSDDQAARCGYSVLITDRGDLVFRASFQACHVYIQMATDYHLHVWLVELHSDGKVQLFPFQLHCTLREQWSSREIVCEENYMEVSIKLPVQTEAFEKNDETELAMTFHRVDQHQENPTVMSLTEAAAHGYHISVRGSFLIFRCLYSSNFSYIIKDSGVDLELVSATVFYPFLSSFLAIDATVACTLNDATVDQSDLLWTLPLVPSPLVHGLFKYKGVTFGVDGRAFSESDIEQGGYKISLQRRRVEVRIPTGAAGVHVKSVVVQGRYSQSISVDLSIMSQWENKHWPWTQLRIFRRLKALIPATHFLNRNRTTSNDSFSATLGPFAPDVSLEKVTLTSGGDLLTWTSSHHPQHDKDFVISKLSNNTGSYTFQLCFPLSHPKIIPEFIGGGVKTYSFTFIFTFNISPSGEVFYHQEEVEHSVEYTAPSSPKLEGKCTDSSLLVLLHHGAHTQLQWELFLGNQRLDWELAEMGGFVVETGELYVTVEIPMYSPVLSFEELTLRGVIAGIKLFLVDAVSLKILASLDFNCNFPVREILVCLPQERMVAVVDTTHTIPPVQPNRTALLDPSCVPLQTDSSRALFSFSLDSCGTTVTTEGQFLVYENQISYKQDFLPVYDPVIHRDSPYRLTIQCRYPANDSSALTVQYPVNSAMNLSEIIPVKQTKSSI